jgi:hypothetical protein
MFPVSAAENTALAEGHGLAGELLATGDPALLDRSDVHWSSVALRAAHRPSVAQAAVKDRAHCRKTVQGM